MKLISLHVARIDSDGKVTFLVSKSQVDSFGYLERKPIRDIAAFLTRQILPKINVGERKAVTHAGYLSCSLRWSDGLGVTALVDQEYPMRIAFQLINIVHDDFRRTVREAAWKNVTSDDKFPEYKEKLKGFLKSYQNPAEFDAVTKVQSKVDATREVMKQNIEKVLGNQEQIEQLLEKSEDISAQSEMMFKAAKKTNKGCCKMQ